MSNFVNMAKRVNDVTVTENGAKAFRSTGGGALLDLFSIIGGKRNDPSSVVPMWREARAEDKELADNLILYARNIRDGGIGERNIGRLLLAELGKVDPRKVARNFSTIVNAGRWDDIFIFLGTPLEREVLDFIKIQLKEDLGNMNGDKPISLLAKWLPSINTSCAKTRSMARKIAHSLGMDQRTYRKTLSAMREHLNIVEKRMSARDWNSIDFESVPSLAMNRYQKAFANHCDNWSDYVASLERGEAKVNASTLFPYDICMKYFTRNISSVDEAAWKALPNFVDDDYNVVVMADVSGSMTCDNYRPIATSVGLATYFAQRNKGAYHNMYMTFTDDPHFIFIKDNMSLNDIFRKVQKEGVGYSTNLDRAFAEIFRVAKSSGEAPQALVVISDCEIDNYRYRGTSDGIVEKWDAEFKKAGFDRCPKVIFWNVENRNGSYLDKAYQNVSYISGYGASQFKHLGTLINNSAYKAMVEILSKPEFSWK